MRSKIGEKAERRRKLTRLRVRKFRGSKIDSDESVYDIPKDLEVAKYWRRWSEMRREIDAALKYFWKKRDAHNNKRTVFFRKKFSGKSVVRATA